MNQAMGHGSIDNRHGGCVGSCGYGLVAALMAEIVFLIAVRIADRWLALRWRRTSAWQRASLIELNWPRVIS